MSENASDITGHRANTAASANPSGAHSSAASDGLAESNQQAAGPTLPSISLPKGGGAIRGIGEKFQVNAVNGTAAFSIPIPISQSRSGFGPSLQISYNSGAGNGPFGVGFSLSLPEITRKTDKGLPRYADDAESDVFILSGSEDLVPVLVRQEQEWRRKEARRILRGIQYIVHEYRPRVEGLFARIERWTAVLSNETHWRTISRDNVTSIFGRTADSRISDPHESERVFSWLICESHDSFGNAVSYEYKRENDENIDIAAPHETNRPPNSRSVNRYIKRIRYGNRLPVEFDADLTKLEWMFDLVFDYGEHNLDIPRTSDSGRWSCRKQPFSSYRAGFEIRTYRLCRRVLMFHHFPDEPGIGLDCLVISLDLHYTEETDFDSNREPMVTAIKSAALKGYRRSGPGYLVRSHPPLELEYTRAEVHNRIVGIDSDSLENMPGGSPFQWIDLDSQGLSGLLFNQGNGWHYKRNLGNAHFGPIETVLQEPSISDPSSVQLMDITGDGRLDVVSLTSFVPGFFEREAERGWSALHPFVSLPNIDWADPNVRLLDADGDGLADVLITQDEAFTVYLSEGARGFGSPQSVFQPKEGEDEGPRIVFSQADHAIYQADMSGDGLSDLVRIRNGEVCYWPNEGYGKFGRKIVLDHSPWFDAPDLFNPGRIRLADIDGSGTTDIIYLSRQTVYLYFNRSGNELSDPYDLDILPDIDDSVRIDTTDLMGNGTACLVWSSPSPFDQLRSFKYVELMGGQKPHLLSLIRNNLGVETHLKYGSSTTFHIADAEADRPWVTLLPFPVQVLVRSEVVDAISHNRYVSRYAYHHGYYDGFEREFRGFGMVEQWDTEEFAALDDRRYQAPPVHTKTWFHLGDYLQDGPLTHRYEEEYYLEPGADRSPLLPDSELPFGLSLLEEREACRSLKGLQLRTEVYSDDATECRHRPYTVTESRFKVRFLQPVGPNKHASFFSFSEQSVSLNYERDLYNFQGEALADPRISHKITLAVDDYGNVLESADIGYGRRFDDLDPSLSDEDHRIQSTIHATYTANGFTNAVNNELSYRTPAPYEVRKYEILSIRPATRELHTFRPFGVEEIRGLLRKAGDGAHDLPFQDFEGTRAVGESPYRRLIEHTRAIFRKDDLTAPLPLGRQEARALPYESYQLALTPDLVSSVYEGRVSDDILAIDAGYVHALGDPNWWTASGRLFYSPDGVHELNYARRHFFLPHRFLDSFGNLFHISYDPYDLLTQETRDALDNRITAGERDANGLLILQGNDYRVLQPYIMMDANRNRSHIAFDALGLVAGTAVMGKPEQHLGDSLHGFEPDLNEDVVLEHILYPLSDPLSILKGASQCLVYDLFAYMRTKEEAQPSPGVIYTLERETHLSDLLPGEHTKVQHGFSYSDGLGRVIQSKLQAEPGPLHVGGVHLPVRWIGTGWTIYNNKGNAVRKYEPFFSPDHAFQFEHTEGVSSTLFYDPLERVVATLHPDHTYEKTVFDAWKQEIWNAGDTLLQDPASDPDVGSFFKRLPEADYLPTWYELRISGAHGRSAFAAAKQTEVQARTPSVSYFDSLGRPFLSIAHNRVELEGIGEKYLTRSTLDIQGNQRAVVDSLGRTAVTEDFDFLGQRLRQSSIDSGQCWGLQDVQAQAVHGWNSRQYHTVHHYDALRRPTGVAVSHEGGPTRLVARTIYGETHPNALTLNLRGRPYLQLDQSGASFQDAVVPNNSEIAAYDFKGNLLGNRRRFAREYRELIDWAALESLFTSAQLDLAELFGRLEAFLHREEFPAFCAFDALNRTTSTTAPDGSMVRPIYNEANLLDRLQVRLKGASEWSHFISGLTYNARGQRAEIQFGNGAKTHYFYDPEMFRLTHLKTCRRDAREEGRTVQDLLYTYDPVGNITNIKDEADIHNVVFFRNRRISPSADFVYDAISRLIEATGREHLGQTGATPRPPGPNGTASGIGILSPSDGTAMGRYTERYAYDSIGNILELLHRSDHGGWKRRYEYDEPNNRLSETAVGDGKGRYEYDAQGNMVRMPSLEHLQWDFTNQLHVTQTQVVTEGDGERTYHIYDATGQRVRKVTEKIGGIKRHERLYLGGFEVYRKYDGRGEDRVVERETLHVMDDTSRIALVDTTVLEVDPGAKTSAVQIRYQFGNQIASATLELDEECSVITYEEYYPFGASSYLAGKTLAEVREKRYRYIGKECDKETGLYYCEARHYAPWLGRWINCDPIGYAGGLNLYSYAENSPIVSADPRGTDPQVASDDNPNNPNNYADFDTFAQNAVGPWTDEGLRDAWDEAHGDDQIDPTDQDNDPASNAAGDGTGGAGGASGTGGAGGASGTAQAAESHWYDRDPSLGQSLIPVVGSGWQAVTDFRQGKWVRGIGWTALAVTDVFLVKSIVVGGVKLTFGVGAKLAAREIAVEVSPKVVADVTANAGKEGLVWTSQKGIKVQVVQLNGWWAKRAAPDAVGLSKNWAQMSMEAQAQALDKLGDKGVQYFIKDGVLFTADAGKAMSTGGAASSTFWKSWAKGSVRMGTVLNDIRPRNMNAAGVIFDPAWDAVTKTIFQAPTTTMVKAGSYEIGEAAQ